MSERELGEEIAKHYLPLFSKITAPMSLKLDAVAEKGRVEGAHPRTTTFPL
ncbi:hypothetical protein QO004_005035 [Rhizobium mesoamericanum]|nr:hypothetical protein [Rhizobium mesoamericanum]